MRWNVTTSAYEIVKRSPPGCVKDTETLITKILSESEMDESSTADSTEQRLRVAFETRIDPDKFCIEVEENSWGFWPRPINLYSWIALCGFEPPCGFADVGDFDQDFLVLSYRARNGESLHLNVEKLNPTEQASFIEVQKRVLNSEFQKAVDVPLPTYTLHGADLFSLPVEVSGNPVLRAPREVIRRVGHDPSIAIASTARSMDEALSLSALFEAAIERWESPLVVLVIEPQTKHHSHWVVCLADNLADQMATWFQPPTESPVAH